MQLLLDNANVVTIKSTTGASFDTGAGNDSLTGGSGNDTLAGGSGKDMLKGGAGTDTFCFVNFGAADADTIADFKGGEDKLYLGSAFTSLANGITSANLRVGSKISTAETAEQFLIFDTASKALYYDADGASTASSAELVATLTGVNDLQASWLVNTL